ncbi:MAG: DUF493 family protein [Dokdonella sp.]
MVQNLDDIHSQQPGQGFQFPGVFEITAIGSAEANLEVRMPEILAEIDLPVISGSSKVRPSSAGNYLSVSMSFTCPSRERYDLAHAKLREELHIRWTL